jgi:hypothetical protein
MNQSLDPMAEAGESPKRLGHSPKMLRRVGAPIRRQQHVRNDWRTQRRALGVPPHVRWIAETRKGASVANREVLFGHQLAVCQEPDADDEVLDTLEAQLRALAPHRVQPHSGPQRKVTRPTNRPGIAAHGLDERLQQVQPRLGVENELGDPIPTGSLDQAEQFVTPARGEDLNTRLRCEIEPVRVDWRVAWKQAQGRAAQQWLHATRVDGCARVGQIDDDNVTRPHFLCRRRGSPMSRIDLRFEGAAHRGACAVDRTEQMHGG